LTGRESLFYSPLASSAGIRERAKDFQSSVEDAKASGLVARAIEKTGARGVSVPAPAK
jgi:hypothetical protein